MPKRLLEDQWTAIKSYLMIGIIGLIWATPVALVVWILLAIRSAPRS